MSLKVEVVGNVRVDGREFLQTSFEPKPGHGSLSSTKWQLENLDAIVFLTTSIATGRTSVDPSQ